MDAALRTDILRAEVLSQFSNGQWDKEGLHRITAAQEELPGAVA